MLLCICNIVIIITQLMLWFLAIKWVISRLDCKTLVTRWRNSPKLAKFFNWAKK